MDENSRQARLNSLLESHKLKTQPAGSAGLFVEGFREESSFRLTPGNGRNCSAMGGPRAFFLVIWRLLSGSKCPTNPLAPSLSKPAKYLESSYSSYIQVALLQVARTKHFQCFLFKRLLCIISLSTPSILRAKVKH